MPLHARLAPERAFVCCAVVACARVRVVRAALCSGRSGDDISHTPPTTSTADMMALPHALAASAVNRGGSER